ncbi:MAG: dTDP-4-dehydrorhamnose reductase [Spirochaetes bacterium GWB1_48_6]|nr:MAG: dTDP-4-dehydrorhamnose reductase [Spirochaetes bacterium GWB1_48_6]
MIWLIGNKGMLGTELSLVLKQRGLSLVGTDRELDILDPSALEAFAAGKDIRWVINCAAYTAVDKAEDEEAFALRLNAEGPGNIARLCARIGARVIHISTDYVFSGEGTSPYLESDPTDPTGAYGRTKAEGERVVLGEAPDAIIIRTAWLYGRYGPNFVATMLKLMAARDEIGVVADQKGTPTWAYDLSQAVADITTKNNFPAGIYHFTNAGETTWYEFALEIQRVGTDLGLLTRTCRTKALSTAEYPTKTKRPAYSVLAKDKILAAGITVPDWKMSLRDFLTSLGTDLA